MKLPGPAANAAKPNSRRHRGTMRTTGLIELPAGGCDEPVPALPKTRKWTLDERKLWRNLWESPQATQWDDSFLAAVAAYVCHATAVYSGSARAWEAQEMRHLGAQLGLTPQGMLSLGWVMTDGQ